MKSVYQLDRETMAAWMKWNKAQEEADRAQKEYDKAVFEMNKRLEEDGAKNSPADES